MLKIYSNEYKNTGNFTPNTYNFKTQTTDSDILSMNSPKMINVKYNLVWNNLIHVEDKATKGSHFFLKSSLNTGIAQIG